MSTLNGLPAHVLLVHAIVVLLPLAAVLLVLTAAWPAARHRLAGPNALLSVGVLVLVPITTDAGEWLERRVPSTQLVRNHAELGDTALFVALPVTIMALVIWWRSREAAAVAGRTASPTAGGTDIRPGTHDLAVATRAEPAVARRVWLAPGSVTVTRLILALAIVIAAIAVYDIYRIGDSGAKASWQANFTSAPAPTGPGPTRGSED